MAFPNSLFPGVYTRLVDTSFSIPSSGASNACICLLAEKGPDNQLLNIGSIDEQLSKLGSIDVARFGQGGLVLSNWFLAASSAYVMRVMPDSTNLPCQSSVYDNVFGTYSIGKIKMKEAAYANIGIAVNELGNLELINIGPVYYGELNGVDQTIPPTNPEVDDAYAIKYGKNIATGDWAGKEGYIAKCQSANPVQWQFSQIDSVGTAIVGTGSSKTEMAVAANYVPISTTVSEWREFDINDIDDDDVDKIVVLDVLNDAPTDPEIGDSYLIANPDPTTGVWADRAGQVATWDGEIWSFSSADYAVISKSFQKSAAPVVTPSETEFNKGNKYLVSENASGDWSGHENQIAYIVSEVTPGDPPVTTYKWAFLILDITSIGSVPNVIIQNSSDRNYLCYAEYDQTEKKVIWTSDVDATFTAYLRRTAELKSILNVSRPDLANDENTVEPLFFFYPVGRGTYYNNIQISLSLSAKSQHETKDYDRTLMLDIYDTNSGSKLLVESFEVSLDPNKVDAVNDSSLFMPNVVNKFSNVLRCMACDSGFLTEDNAYMITANTDIDALFTEYERTHKIGTTTYSPALAYGTNGNLYKDSGSIDWTVAKSLLAKAYTGVIIDPQAEDANNPYATDILDTEMVLIDLIFDAGYPKAVKTAIMDLITARSNDCVGIIDMGDNATAEAAFKARTEEGGVGKEFNTPYIAIYEPYTNIYDKYSGLDLWVSPVFHAARAFAITDRDYGRHYAPAGINRGMCYGINSMRYNLYKESAYKDKFVSYCINPIIANRSGYVIYGQSTSYLKASKFQDINIVRTVVEIERDLKLQLQNMLFDFNDGPTRNFYSILD